MEQEELKRKLLGLWEKTTHNPKDYLAVLFNYYFDMRYIEYKEQDGKVVSALCGIPYDFGYGSQRLKGLYIISLTSEEGFRKKGILSDLLFNFNQRLKEEFDFTFLIPHTELLADYFGTQGYFNSFFILEERFTPLHDFRNDYLLSLTDSDERIRELKNELMNEIQAIDNKAMHLFSNEQIVRFVEEVEKKSTSSVNLYHTEKDLEYLLDDMTIRNLGTYISYDAENKITGIAFIQKEDNNRIRVVSIYVTDTCSYYVLLDKIKRDFQDYSISVNTSDPKYQTHALIQTAYAAANAKGGDLDSSVSVVEIPLNTNKLLQPLGMVRLLNIGNIIDFIAKTHSDVEFRLHIRNVSLDSNTEEEYESVMVPDYPKNPISEIDKVVSHKFEDLLFVVKNGKLHLEPYDKHKHDTSILNLSVKEFSELVLRKNDSSNLIMEAFGIPRLNLQMRLLPC